MLGFSGLGLPGLGLWLSGGSTTLRGLTGIRAIIIIFDVHSLPTSVVGYGRITGMILVVYDQAYIEHLDFHPHIPFPGR